MTYENVKFGKECRDKIIEGINLAANAVERTFGPKGRNAIVRSHDGLLITKDGYHTAMLVNDKDPYISMGIDIIQDICRKTANDIGDGTSSSAILAKEIINAFKDYADPVYLVRVLQILVQATIAELKSKTLNITNSDLNPYWHKCKLQEVATTSANGDTEIGNLVADVFEKVGDSGFVLYEQSEEVQDRVEYSDGFRIDSGFASTYYVNNTKGTCELENVKVFISDTKIEEVKQVLELAKVARENGQSLLLVAPDFDSEIHVFLSQNKDVIKSCAIYSPNRRTFREIALKDMRLLLGESSVCKKVTITNKTTTFNGCSSYDFTDRVNELKELVSNALLPEFDRLFYKKQLANFTGGMATIYVGGFSKLEMRERFDRVEDAVCATQAAIDGGILVGGGKSLSSIELSIKTEKSDFDFGEVEVEIDDAIVEIYNQILKTPAKKLGTTNTPNSELKADGVYEPFLVTKTVLENAVSTAALVLTTDVAIINFNNLYMN